MPAISAPIKVVKEIKLGIADIAGKIKNIPARIAYFLDLSFYLIIHPLKKIFLPNRFLIYNIILA